MYKRSTGWVWVQAVEKAAYQYIAAATCCIYNSHDKLDGHACHCSSKKICSCHDHCSYNHYYHNHNHNHNLDYRSAATITTTRKTTSC